MTAEVMLSGAAVACMLAHSIGPMHNWEGPLNDARQGRGGLPEVEPLLPCARRKRTHRTSTPLYRPADVLRFIRQVRLHFRAEKPFAFKAETFIVDHDDAMRWLYRTATPAPEPSP